MNSSVFLIALLCVSLIVIGAIVVLVVMLSKPNSGTTADRTAASAMARRGWRRWLLPVGVALVFSVWSVSLGLFFLLIVWVLKRDPKEKLSNIVSKDERTICETNYKWLRNSSFITIPTFVIALFIGAPPFIAALIPFIFHISVIQRLKTKSLFVYRHTQQTLVLLILRAATATLIFSFFYFDEVFWPFILINGSNWLFGTNWEISQVKRNDSWLMQRRGEDILVSEIPAVEKSLEKRLIDYEIEEMLKSLNVEGSNPRQKALRAFRIGAPEVRKQAVLILSKLGEVEKF